MFVLEKWTEAVLFFRLLYGGMLAVAPQNAISHTGFFHRISQLEQVGYRHNRLTVLVQAHRSAIFLNIPSDTRRPSTRPVFSGAYRVKPVE